jgi:hypothetical protein
MLVDGVLHDYHYVVLGLAAAPGLAEPGETLRQELYAALLRLKKSTQKDDPILIWRRRVEEMQEGGKHKISIRVAIPGADYSQAFHALAPEGFPFSVIEKRE